MRVQLLSFFLIFFFSSQHQTAEAHLAAFAPRTPLRGIQAPVGSLWPRPLFQNSVQNVFTVDTLGFQTQLFGQDQNGEPINCPSLDFAKNHYTNLIKDLSSRKKSQDPNQRQPLLTDVISTLRIELLECTADFLPDALESYKLTVTMDNETGNAMAVLKSDVPLGVMRGLETFYQLLWSTENRDGSFSPVYINETVVSDRARFSHRGMMLDTARHYLPEQKIVQILTIMMYNKLNVFHWHIVDDQSFPFVSQRFPELSAEGAYNFGAVYEPETVARIIEAARVRGIRVILEFDTPGHVDGFGKSHPELLTPCYGDGVHPETPNYPEHAARENLDPTNEKVYEFMREFFTEVVQNVTKDQFVHLGMDEVNPPCWKSSPIIKAFMLNRGYTRYTQVQEYYTKRHIEMVKSLGVTPITWQDPMDEGVELDKDVVLQIWKDWNGSRWPDALKKALDKGHRVILSACWYINYINYGESWRAYYDCDPILGANVPEAQKDQVLGGEACIWAEFVDQTNIVPRLFPFASAVAEVLWTERDTIEDTDDAMWRLDQFRCSLLRRGVPAQPILSGHCGSYEATIFSS